MHCGGRWLTSKEEPDAESRNGLKKLQSSFVQLAVGTLTGHTVSGVCYESICPSSKTRNNIVKR
jgi:hypothetical protein